MECEISAPEYAGDRGRWDTPKNTHPCAGSGGDVLSPHGPSAPCHPPSPTPRLKLTPFSQYQQLDTPEVRSETDIATMPLNTSSGKI
ncbi:Uncharacterised protein [Halioglobus japonicus]|nr:Uncharacterised protein [Halioglobus japonicus]